MHTIQRNGFSSISSGRGSSLFISIPRAGQILPHLPLRPAWILRYTRDRPLSEFFSIPVGPIRRIKLENIQPKTSPVKYLVFRPRFDTIVTSRKENIYVRISKEERDSLQKCGEDSFLSTVREVIINSRTLHPFVPWLIAKIISGGCAFFDLYLYLSLSLPRCTCCILPNGTSSLTRSFHGRESVHGFVGNVVLRNLFDRRTRCVFARSRRLLLRPRMLPVKD